MSRKQILITVALVLLAAAAGYLLAPQPGAGLSYTLYRDSPVGKDLRLHVATFDSSESEDYNRENCLIAAQLFQAQPLVTVRYWCEKGRYRQ